MSIGSTNYSQTNKKYGHQGRLFSPYPFRLDTTQKTLTCDGSFSVCSGKWYKNNLTIDISNFDKTAQGVFYVDINANKIKWMGKANYQNSNVESFIIGETWSVNGTYGNYGCLYIDNEFYVDGILMNTKGFYNRFNKSNMIFDGDSICYGSTGTSTASVTFPQQIGRQLGLPITNMAVSGCCIADNPSNNHVQVVDRSGTTNFSSYDIMVISAGTNDYGYATTIGTIDSTDTSEFYGALNAIVDNVYTSNPNIRLIFILPFFRSYVNKTVNGVSTRVDGNAYDITNNAGSTLKDYCDAIVNICNKYNLLYFNTLNNSPINPLNYESKLTNESGKYLHPTSDTHIEIGNRIASFINSSL